MFPRLKGRGRIEARLNRMVIGCSIEFPRLKSRGRIEAADDGSKESERAKIVSTAEKSWPN